MNNKQQTLEDRLIAALNITVPRFRGAELVDTADGKLLYVRCRGGGDNREWHTEEWDAVYTHPCYMTDEDDDFDNTYAEIVFKIPADLDVNP